MWYLYFWQRNLNGTIHFFRTVVEIPKHQTTYFAVQNWGCRESPLGASWRRWWSILRCNLLLFSVGWCCFSSLSLRRLRQNCSVVISSISSVGDRCSGSCSNRSRLRNSLYAEIGVIGESLRFVWDCNLYSCWQTFTDPIILSNRELSPCQITRRSRVANVDQIATIATKQQKHPPNRWWLPLIALKGQNKHSTVLLQSWWHSWSCCCIRLVVWGW